MMHHFFIVAASSGIELFSSIDLPCTVHSMYRPTHNGSFLRLFLFWPLSFAFCAQKGVKQLLIMDPMKELVPGLNYLDNRFAKV